MGLCRPPDAQQGQMQGANEPGSGQSQENTEGGLKVALRRTWVLHD